MAVGDSIRDFYFSLEDKYYGFLDWLERRGIHAYWLTDIVESRGLPSFPFFLLLLLLLVVGAWLFVLPAILLPQQVLLTVNVSDFADNSPIENALVTVTISGEQKFGATNAVGEASFLLPVGREAVAEAKKDNYKPGQASFIVSELDSLKNILLEKTIGTTKKTVQVLDGQTGSLVTKQVTIRFACSSSSQSVGEKTTQNGIIELDVPENCGVLRAEVVGAGKLENSILDPKESVSAISFSEREAVFGTVNVYVNDSDSNPVAGAKVRLLTAEGIESDAAFTAASGTARFDSVETGTYYVVVHDESGRFRTFNGSSDRKEILSGKTTVFNAVLARNAVGKIKIAIKDATSNQPVQNALVRLLKDNVELESAYSGADGRVEFNVSEDTEYIVAVDHSEYLIAVVSHVSPKATDNDILLKRAVEGIANRLLVKVVDPAGKPVENAKLLLKKDDGIVIATGAATGIGGTASFENLPVGETFIVFAARKGFEGKNSDPATILARQENTVTIVLNIGSGGVLVAVVDEQGQAVDGARARVFEMGKLLPVAEQLADLDGKTSFSIRADLDVFIIAEKQGFLQYTTARIPVDEGTTIEKKIVLYKNISSLSAELLGLFKDNASAVGTLSAGQRYTARLLLKLPARESNYPITGIHFRTGKSESGSTSIVEEDNIFIGDVWAATTSIERGASYSSPTGLSTDSRRLTSGEAKWANIYWSNVPGGVFEAETEVFVRENAVLGEQLLVWYRGWAQLAEGFVRHPADAGLGRLEQTSQKQALYANALLAQYSVGPTNLCSAGYCRSFVLEDKETGAKTFVVNYFPAQVSKNYTIGFTVSKTSGLAESNAEIVFSSENSGVLFSDYSITGADGRTLNGKADSSEAGVAVGSLEKDSVVFGRIDFKTLSDGLNTIRVKIVSGQRELFNEIIDVDVASAFALQIDAVPQEIVPLIDNDVVAKVTDEEGKPISKATVKLFSNNSLIATRETNNDGQALFKISSPAPGNIITISAQKTGYREAFLRMPVDESLLFVRPQEIVESLSLTKFFRETGMLVKNKSSIPLTLSDVRFSDSFEQLVSFDTAEPIVGELLETDTDKNFSLQIELTDKAFDELRANKKLSGTMSIFAFSEQLSRTFVSSVPISITIGLGTEVDNEKCLVVEPGKIDILAHSERQEFEVKLSNKCTAQKTPIALRDIEVKLDNKGKNALGDFSIKQKSSGTEKEIGASFSALLDRIEAQETIELVLFFNPNSGIRSGKAAPEIVFRATNRTARETEEITSTLKAQVNVNDLSSCVQVARPPVLLVEAAPFNLGYSAYNNFGLYPQATLANSSYPFTGTTGLATGGYGYSFPSASYTNPFFTRSFDTAADSQFAFGQGTSGFSVKNNCTIPIDVSVDSGSFLRTDKSSFSLQPDKEELVNVQSGNRIGRFEVKVKAKRQASENEEKEIDRIPVVVQGLNEIGQNCISLSTTVFNFGYSGQTDTKQIINECYDAGVRLARTPDVLTISCSLSGTPQLPGIFSPEASIKANVLNLQAPGQGYIPGIPNQRQFIYNPGEIPLTGQGYNPYNPYYSGAGYYGYNPYNNAIPGQGYPNNPVYGQGNYNYFGQGTGQYYPPYYGAGYPGLGANNYLPGLAGTGACPLIQSINILDTYTVPTGFGKTTEIVNFEIIPSVQQPYGQQPFSGAFPGYGSPYQNAFPGAYPSQIGAGFPGGALGIFPGQNQALFNYFQRSPNQRITGIANIKFSTASGQQGLERERIIINPPFSFFGGIPFPWWMQPPIAPGPNPRTPTQPTPPVSPDKRPPVQPTPPDQTQPPVQPTPPTEAVPQPNIPPSNSPESCVNDDAFNTVAYWEGKGTSGFTPQSFFSGNTAEWLPGRSPSDSLPLLSSFGPCSTATISNVQAQAPGVQGMGITFAPAEAVGNGYRNITMTIDKSGMTSKCAGITAEVSFEEFLPIASPDLAQAQGTSSGFLQSPTGQASMQENFFSGFSLLLQSFSGQSQRYIVEQCKECPAGTTWKLIDSKTGMEIERGFKEEMEAKARELNNSELRQGELPGNTGSQPGYTGELNPPEGGYIKNDDTTPSGTGFGGIYGQGQNNRLPHTLTATIMVFRQDVSPEEAAKIKSLADCQEGAIPPDQIQPPVTPTANACPITNAYSKYGFDKLSFDWSWKTNSMEACNPPLLGIDREKGIGIYDERAASIKNVCDGVQFSASVLKMAEKTKAVTVEAFNKTSVLLKQDQELLPKVDEWNNSLDSWRLAKKQAIIEDRQELQDAENRKAKRTFFVRGNDIVIDRENAQKLADTMQALKAKIEKQLTPDNTAETKQALKELLASEFGNMIVGTFDASGNEASFNDELSGKNIPELFGAEKLGAKANFAATANYNVITFKEYVDLWEKITEPFEKDKEQRKKRFTDAGIENMRKTAKAFAETKKSCAGVIDDGVLEKAGIQADSEDGKKLKGMNVAYCHSTSSNDAAKADVCWICNAEGKGQGEGTGLVEIKAQFLKDFVNALKRKQENNESILGFRVGLMHTPQAQFKQSVLDATDIPEIAQYYSGIENFGNVVKRPEQQYNEFFFRFVDFKSFLIEDSMNDSLRQQFSKRYAGAGELVPSFVNWKTPSFEQTGSYPIQLIAKNPDKQAEWEIKKAVEGGREFKSIAQVSADYANNVFMHLPFDGDLDSRNGFGVAFSSMKATSNVGVSEKGSGATALAAGAYFYNGKGFQNNTFGEKSETTEEKKKKDKVLSTVSGKIAQISKAGADGFFQFYPSKPFTYTMQTGQGNLLAMVYEFSDRENMPESGVISWRDKASKQETVEEVVSKQNAELCGMQNPSRNFQGFVKPTNVQASTLVGYTFLPSGTGSTLIAYCAAPGQVSLNGQNVPSKLGGTEKVSGQTTVNGIEYAQTAGKEMRYLKDFIELLKDDSICIEGQTTADKIQLVWNKNKIGGS